MEFVNFEKFFFNHTNRRNRNGNKQIDLRVALAKMEAEETAANEAAAKFAAPYLSSN